MEENKLVSYIIPAYKDVDGLRECLRSIKKQKYEEKEIIVVIDGGNKEIREIIESEFKKVKMISLPRNYGHAGASNIGIETAKGKYVALLDEDSRIDEDWTSKLVSKFKSSHGGVGVIEPKLIDHKNGESKNVRYDEEKNLDIFTSAGVLAKKESLKDAEYYDENFFIYKDDYDLAANILNEGYEILAFPEATTYHTHDPDEKPSPFTFFYETRNQFWYYWKHYDRYNSLIMSLRHFTKTGLKSLNYGYKQRYVKAILSASRRFPDYFIHNNKPSKRLEYPHWTLDKLKKSLSRFFRGKSTFQEEIFD
jgi:GT2 family glycosyltransferase